MLGHPPARGKSPIVERDGKKYPEMVRNGIINGEQRINRIDLRGTAIIEITHVDSPSCIWARLPNHITDKLTITEPYNLEKANFSNSYAKIKGTIIDKYYMAPMEERTYSRVRVLKAEVIKNELYVKVIYIDHGMSRWLHVACLANLPKTFFYHPWQALCISVTDITKINFGRSYGECTTRWTIEECDMFRNLVSRFSIFQVRALFGSVIRNDYREPHKVELYGIDNEEQENLVNIFKKKHIKGTGQSISCLYAAESNGKLQYIEISNASNFPIIPYDEVKENMEELAATLNDIPLFLKKFPDNWITRENTETSLIIPRDEWDTWKFENSQIPYCNVDWLHANDYFDEITQSYWLIIEGNCTQSPWEWYARPIRRLKKEMSATEKENIQKQLEQAKIDENPEDQAEIGDINLSILTADSELKNYAKVLDSFYGISDNRHVINTEEACLRLSQGLNVFAITWVPESRSVHTGEWQRVQVVKIHEYAEVRFLDSGGRDTVAPLSLFKIHPRHTTYPPLCVQLCLHGVCDPDEEEKKKKTFNMKRRKAFAQNLRVDIPLMVELFAQPFRNIPRKGNIKPFEEDHVLYIIKGKIMGRKRDLHEWCTGSGGNRLARDQSLPINLNDQENPF